MEDEERRPLLEGRNEGSSIFAPTSSTNGQTVPRHDEEEERGEEEDEQPQQQGAGQLLLGLACTLCATTCFASVNAMVKGLPENSSYDMLLLRSTIQILLMLPLLVCSDRGSPLLPSHDWNTRCRVLGQGVLGGFLLLSILEAVARLPLGDSTAIMFSEPAFTMTLSLIILRDHCGLWRVLVAITTIVGVVIVSRPPAIFPPPDTFHLGADPLVFNKSFPDVNLAESDKSLDQLARLVPSLSISGLNKTYPEDFLDQSLDELTRPVPSLSIAGLMWALAVPVLSGLINILTRQANHVHYSFFVFWLALGSLTVATGGLICMTKLPFKTWSALHWTLGVAASLTGVLGRVLYTKALTYISPNQTVVVACLEVVIAFLFQITVFSEPAHWTDGLGSLLIVSAVAAMAFEAKIMEKLQWPFL